MTADLVTIPNQIANLALPDRTVGKAQFCRPNFTEHHSTDSGFDHFLIFVTVYGLLAIVRIQQQNPRMGVQFAVIKGENHFFFCAEETQALTLLFLFTGLCSQVVASQGDILGRSHDGLTTGWAENIVGSHHQQSGFHLCLDRQGHMNRHLVTIEVRVVSSTNQWMHTNSLTLDQYGLKGLNGKSVQGRRTIQ